MEKYDFKVALFGAIYEADPISLTGDRLIHNTLYPKLWMVADHMRVSREKLYQDFVKDGYVRIVSPEGMVIVTYPNDVESCVTVH